MSGVFCDLCLKPIGPNTARVQVGVAPASDGRHSMRRIAALHEHCWAHVQTSMKQARAAMAVMA